MNTLRALCPAFALVLTACGGSALKEPEAADPAVLSPGDAPEPKGEASPEPKGEALPEPKGDPGSDAQPEPRAPLKGREVTYRMTPSGLIIEVEGVEFSPTATAVKAGASGGYDIALKVKATARDGQMHRLLSPENGPLMVATRIERRGKSTDVTDERRGDGEVFIAPDDSLDLERRITAKVGPGATVSLQVGLWGLGIDADERRPVKKLFFVKMAGSAKQPTPVISAPE